MKIKNREELIAKQEEYRASLNSQRKQILICAGTGCVAGGSLEIYAKMKDIIESKGLKCALVLEKDPHGDSIGLKKSGCHGFCEMGPLLRIEPMGWLYIKVSLDDCEEIIEKSIIGDEVIDRLVYKDQEGNPYVKQEDIPFYKQQTRIALEYCGHINAESIAEYLALGGYSAVAKALFDMTPQGIVDEITESCLRGRGGGGFPAGRKWQQVLDQKEEEKYIVCNGDEGDPGAFMDRSMMEGEPHRVIEGMLIAAIATGAHHGYIYVRAEYPLAVERLQTAIDKAMDRGLLGKDILGSGFDFDLHISQGAGAFVCGEETALMTSIEGNRGEPRPRPPFPAVKGLFQKPTILNNVETWANIPQIIINGPKWFASMGTEKSKGTKVFALGGKINNTGLVEIPMGTTLRTVIEDIGGGIPNGKKFKAAQTGGPSGGCIPAEHFDIPIDYDNLISIGSMMGSGGLIVMDETDCMVDIAKFFLEFTVEESCGKCTPCRVGTKRMLEILTKITKGQATMEDLDKLEELCYYIKENSLCGLGQTAPNPVLSTLHYFRDEYEAHIKEKRCPAGVCKALLSYHIDSSKCKGCTLCARNCPNSAIIGTVRNPHIIDQEKCIKCGACMEKCKFGAIYKK